eukprot:TRINITY_DN598_c1_g1_i2.p1 TRINITY_DN598_c1_g1~~TRINITY_DN598_c1_g1_i2.p1  ORF type:complete len:314 (+),score=105.31 TRINITY_DN598_c1_g1_i2:93-1034(+)
MFGAKRKHKLDITREILFSGVAEATAAGDEKQQQQQQQQQQDKSAPTEVRDLSRVETVGSCPGFDVVSAVSNAKLFKDPASTINAECVARVFTSYGLGPSIFRWAINEEVANTVQAETLFRTNSVTTKMMSALYKKFGKDYIKFCFGPFWTAIAAKDFSLPLSGTLANLQVSEGVDLGACVVKHVQLCQDICERIFVSKDACPMMLRQVFQHVQTTVGRKFPALKTTVVGGFLFLRFLCPSVLHPEQYGMPVEKNTERLLILVSSTLTKLANGMEVSGGDASGGPGAAINAFVAKNFPRLTAFLDQIAVASAV